MLVDVSLSLSSLHPFSTWWPGKKPSPHTAKQYTKIYFWKHLKQEMGYVATESWFTFDQHSLIVQFDQSLVSHRIAGFL